MIAIILLLAIFIPAFSPVEKVCYIPESEVCRPYETIIKAVVMVESSGDTFAYNVKENAVGAFQIRQIRLDEYNRMTGENLKLVACYDYLISKRVFLFYACQFLPDDYKAISKDWNKSKTDKYWNKVKAKL